MPQLSIPSSLLLYLRRSLAIVCLSLIIFLAGLLPVNPPIMIVNPVNLNAAAAIANPPDSSISYTNNLALSDSQSASLSGNSLGYTWLETSPANKLAYCDRAFAAFRGSPAQSYIISSNVQSLTPAGLCDRIDQFFSLEENLETRIAEAAAIAPLLFADTPLGTKYNLATESED
jgi:hypothetical protein